MTLVRAQSQLPGRKVVLYFNPWLFIPRLSRAIQHLISTANRSNVSFYTVDPKDWSLGARRAQSRFLERSYRRNSISADARRRWRSVHAAGARRRNGGGSAPIESANVVARSCQQTGGTAIAETNDWKAPLRTVMTEVRTYYEASYIPESHCMTANSARFRFTSIVLMSQLIPVAATLPCAT